MRLYKESRLPSCAFWIFRPPPRILLRHLQILRKAASLPPQRRLCLQIALPPLCARLLPLTTHLRSLGPDLPDLDRFVLSAILISKLDFIPSRSCYSLSSTGHHTTKASRLSSRSRQPLSAFAIGCSGTRLWLLGTWWERQSSLVGETLICLSPAVWYDAPNSCSLSPCLKTGRPESPTPACELSHLITSLHFLPPPNSVDYLNLFSRHLLSSYTHLIIFERPSD